jgi:hypothetical protein
MPKIAVYKFLTFFIFSYDALNEPPHLHVVKEKGTGSDLQKFGWKLVLLLIPEH